jgi:hypothetical protein
MARRPPPAHGVQLPTSLGVHRRQAQSERAGEGRGLRARRGGVAVSNRLPEWNDQDASQEYALLRRVNKLLAARGSDMRLARSRSAAQRTVLGDYFLVGDPNRHVIIRDHGDLHQFAREALGKPGNE